MMEKKMDLRIQKTQKALFDTFLEMMEESRFEDITVNALCDRALVRRATFYNHFADKYDFFAFFIRYKAEEFMEQADSKMIEGNVHQYCIYSFKRCISFLNEHKALVDNVIDSNISYMLMDIFSGEIYRDVLLCMEKTGCQEKMGKVPMELLAAFYSGGILHIIRYWLGDLTQGVKKLTEEELIENLDKLMTKI